MLTYSTAVSFSEPECSSQARLDSVIGMRQHRMRLVLLDGAFDVLASDAGAADLLLEFGFESGLPASLKRGLSAWFSGGSTADGASFLAAPGLLAHAVSLRGDVCAIGLMLERVSARESLDNATSRFGFSPRERDVIGLVLDGCSTGEIAAALRIGEGTVGDYLKRIFAKTVCRSRSELVAKVLGWRGPSPQAAAGRP